MSELFDGRRSENDNAARGYALAAMDSGTTTILPRVGVTVRAGTADDLPWIDALQKQQRHAVGFLMTAALVGKVNRGEVLVACVGADRAGYLIASDRYYRRDEVGCVTQVNVLPEYRGKLVAGALLQAQFDRSAYGCRLYCCWCAQDLAANAFWEAMGFTPIAFRTGSRTKGSKSTARMHIFWQKRIREGDTTTPWWYPAKTEGGEMREDRLVFPIPPGVHWKDVLPVVLPETGNAAVGGTGDADDEPRRVGFSPPSSESAETRRAEARPTKTPPRRRNGLGPIPVAPPPADDGVLEVTQAEYDTAWAAIRERVKVNPPPPVRPKHIPPGRPWFLPDYNDYQPTDLEIRDEILAMRAAAEKAKKVVAKTQKTVDPRLVAMSRELRDRWSERADLVLALPGKHDVRRALDGPTTVPMALPASTPKPALPDAA